jgi:hypothetical protein
MELVFWGGSFGETKVGQTDGSKTVLDCFGMVGGWKTGRKLQFRLRGATTQTYTSGCKSLLWASFGWKMTYYFSG